MDAYGWSWAVASAHVEAVNILYARQQVGNTRITRSRTQLPLPVPLEKDLEELVKEGLPLEEAVQHQINRLDQQNALKGAIDKEEEIMSPIQPRSTVMGESLAWVKG